MVLAAVLGLEFVRRQTWFAVTMPYSPNECASFAGAAVGRVVRVCHLRFPMPLHCLRMEFVAARNHALKVKGDEEATAEDRPLSYHCVGRSSGHGYLRFFADKMQVTWTGDLLTR